MRHYRVTTRNVLVCQFVLFESAEAAYLWYHTQDREPHETRVIELRQQDFADIEWLGCEFIHEGNNRYTCLNLVNVAWAKATDNESGFVVEPVFGWVVDGVLPLRETTTRTLMIRRLSSDEGIRVPHPMDTEDD